MDVKLRADLGGGGTQWTIDGKKPRESVITVGHKSGAQTLDFKLDDHTRLGFRFDQSDPLWVHEAEEDQCPSRGIDTDQIRIESCDDKRLSVADANSGMPRTLHYQLNLLDDRGNSVTIDPVIKNGGNL